MTISLLAFLVSKIVLLTIQKENENFKKSKRNGTAIITGYASNSTSANIRFMVKVLNLDDDRTYNLQGTYNVDNFDGSSNKNCPNFHIGDQVKIVYAPQNLFGVHFLNVKLDREYYRKQVE